MKITITPRMLIRVDSSCQLGADLCLYRLNRDNRFTFFGNGLLPSDADDEADRLVLPRTANSNPADCVSFYRAWYIDVPGLGC